MTDAIAKAMPNRNSVKRQLKIDKPRYLFTKTHKPKTKKKYFTKITIEKKHYHNMRQWSELLMKRLLSA